MNTLTRRLAVTAGLAAAAIGVGALPATAATPIRSDTAVTQPVTHYKGGKVTVTNSSTVTVSLRVTMVNSYDWYEGHAPNDAAPEGFQGARLAPGQSVSSELGVWIEATSAPFRLTFLTNPNDLSSEVGSAEVIEKRTGVEIRGWGLDRTEQTFDQSQADQTKQGKALIGKRYQIRVQCGLGSGDQTAFTLSSFTP